MIGIGINIVRSLRGTGVYSTLDSDASAQITRISADGGYSHDDAWLSVFIAELKSGSSEAGDCYSLFQGLYLLSHCVKKDGADKVSKIYNIARDSDGSLDCVQPTAASQHLWIESGFDGLPEMKFEIEKSGSYLSAASIQVAQPCTVFCIFKEDGGSIYARVFMVSNMQTGPDSGLILAYAGTHLMTPHDMYSHGLYTSVFNGASSSIHRGENHIISGDAGDISLLNPVIIGGASASHFLSGRIIACGFIPQLIAPEQAAHIRAVFQSRWPSLT